MLDRLWLGPCGVGLMRLLNPRLRPGPISSFGVSRKDTRVASFSHQPVNSFPACFCMVHGTGFWVIPCTVSLTPVATFGVAMNNKIFKHDRHPALRVADFWPIMPVPCWATMRIFCFLDLDEVDSLTPSADVRSSMSSPTRLRICGCGSWR